MEDSDPIENGVLIGQDGWLFLAGGAHHVFEFISNIRKVAPASFKAFETTLINRQKITSQMGIIYKHLIVPDKHTVSESLLRLKDPISLGALYLEQCLIPNDILLFPTTLFREQQGKVYQKTDTHLNDCGNVLIAAAVAQALTGMDLTVHRDILLSKIITERDVIGDLGSKLSPPTSSKEKFLKVDWGPNVFSNECRSNNGLVDIHISTAALLKKRLLLIGDSFGRASCRILSYFFYEVIFMRSPFLHDELITQVCPDYIVTENVERYLSFVRPDDERPNFFMYPYLSDVSGYEPSRSFIEAFSAVLNFPRPPYNRFFEKYPWKGQ